MSSTTAITTPVRKRAQIADSPGQWKHPRLAEITARQNATVFSEANVRKIAWNLAAVVLFTVARRTTSRYMHLAPLINHDAWRLLVAWLPTALYLVFLFNMALAARPLFARRDDLADIALTPGQRQLLGLPAAASAPPTPGSVYSTPPKYSRTPSISGSAKSYASSPLSAGKASPVPIKNGSGGGGGGGRGSPFSPAGSPLLQKAISGRRSSLGGSPGQFGVSTASSLFLDAPSTPSPTSGKKTSVGLNSKWLYEKSRRSSGGGAWLS